MLQLNNSLFFSRFCGVLILQSLVSVDQFASNCVKTKTMSTQNQVSLYTRDLKSKVQEKYRIHRKILLFVKIAKEESKQGQASKACGCHEHDGRSQGHSWCNNRSWTELCQIKEVKELIIVQNFKYKVLRLVNYYTQKSFCFLTIKATVWPCISVPSYFIRSAANFNAKMADNHIQFLIFF